MGKINHLKRRIISCKPPFLGSKILNFPGCFPAKVRTIHFRRGELAGSFRFFLLSPQIWSLLRFSPQGFKCKSALKVLNLSSQEAPPACSCQVTSRASSGAGPGSHLRLMVAALRSKHRPRRRESVSQIPMKDLGGVFLK